MKPLEFTLYCAEGSNLETRAREFRALRTVLAHRKGLMALLLARYSTALELARQKAPKGVTVQPAWEWMLEEAR